jgi:hypothetical protein
MALEVAADSSDPCPLPMELYHTDHLTFHAFGDFLSCPNLLSTI